MKKKTVLLKEVNPEKIKFPNFRGDKLAASYIDDCKKIIQDIIQIINESNVTTDDLFELHAIPELCYSNRRCNMNEKIISYVEEKYGRSVLYIEILRTNKHHKYVLRPYIQPKKGESLTRKAKIMMRKSKKFGVAWR